MKTVITVIFTLFVLTLMGAKINHNETLKDANGKTMGYIKGERVYDQNNKLIGYARSSGTTTASGRMLSKSQLPGLLFCK